jgi:hypothetical protein
MSNRDRIARMREEASANERDRSSVRKTGGGPARLMAVWAVKNGAGEIVATFPYARRDAAVAEAERRNAADRSSYIVCPHRMPFNG